MHEYGEFKESIKEGTSAEQRFEKLILLSGHKIIHTSNYENKDKHKDLFVKNGKGEWKSFDVKNSKRIKRNDNSDSNDYTWVEIKNNFGNPGWLYGKEDYIAFYDSKKDLFVIVERENLVKLIEEKKSSKIYEKNNNLPDYACYTRRTNKDVIVLVPMKDIISICKSILKNDGVFEIKKR